MFASMKNLHVPSFFLLVCIFMSCMFVYIFVSVSEIIICTHVQLTHSHVIMSCIIHVRRRILKTLGHLSIFMFHIMHHNAG